MNASAVETKFQLAVEHHKAGRLESAEALYREILQTEPRHAFARFLLGRVALQNGELARARDDIDQAIAIDDTNPAFYNDLGLVCQGLNRTEEAIVAYQRALALRPELFESGYNLGCIRFGQGRLAEAEELFQKVVAVRPDLAQAWNQLGAIAGKLAKPDEALGYSQKAIALQPDLFEAHHNVGDAWFDIGRPDLARASYERVLAIQPDYRGTHRNLAFTLLYLAESTPTEILESHRRYGALCEDEFKSRWPVHKNGRDPDRRLKVGYVSPDFRRHAVALFIEPVLEHHDHTQVEVYGYYNWPQSDGFTTRIASLCEHWLPCAGFSDDALAARIQNDGIDILVDLAGHTIADRMLTFARKPAPVQVTYLGYPSTTGLSAIDYRLTTSDIDPPGNEAQYSEQLYRLPRTLWCYRPPENAPELDPEPPALATGRITFGSMNILAKVSAQTIAAWAEILHAVPEARLVMTNVPEGGARDGVWSRFAEHGIDRARLDLCAKLPRPYFLATMRRRIDIVLDPFPYNGTTTTCEALTMGLPVVTLTGQTAVARSGHAILKSLGLPGLIGRNVPDYVRIAVDLARDLPRLAALRRAIPTRFMSSPLRKEALLTRDLEEAYRTMWRRWCEEHSLLGPFLVT